jgi:small-conductance mechanosensitive channel
MEKIFNQDFYRQFLEKISHWLLETAPALVLILFLFLISRWILGILVRRIISTIKSRVHNSKSATIEHEKRADTLMGIIRGAINVTLWVVFTLIFIKELGLDIAPILAGAGIAGLAIGFGAQELVRDGISGFFIILEDRIRTGDVVVLNGTGGLVESINLRTITLRDLSGVVHTFQNGKIDTMSNMTKEWSAMVFDIGIAYKENVDEVIPVVKAVGDSLQQDPDYASRIIEPIEIFGLDKFGDSAVIIKARIKTKPIEQWFVGREFNKRLKAAFDEKGIEIPFPHRTIYWGEDISPLSISKQ